MKLEVISRKPKDSAASGSKPTLVFVHGICVGAWVWDEYFLPYFADHGYECHALSLRGHGESEGREKILGWHLSDYRDDLNNVVQSIDGPVVVIGHSMGGAVVQDWLNSGSMKDKAVGIALLASVPPWGLGYSSWHMGVFYPEIFQEMAKMLFMGPYAASETIMQEALFSKGVSQKILDEFMNKLGPESVIASTEVQGLRSFAPLPWEEHPPMFLAGAEDDRFVPPIEMCRMGSYYRVKPVMVKDLAHSVMVDKNWEKMAEPLLAWIKGL